MDIWIVEDQDSGLLGMGPLFRDMVSADNAVTAALTFIQIHHSSRYARPVGVVRVIATNTKTGRKDNVTLEWEQKFTAKLNGREVSL